ncbi:MAG: hypothetical protein ACRDYD_10995 [Acidimicrobiales bacterium]
MAQVRPLFADAWRHRHNITFADATYVALAEHLGAPLLGRPTPAEGPAPFPGAVTVRRRGQWSSGSSGLADS